MFGIALYKFAQEMQIDALTEALVENFMPIKSVEVFVLFDLFHASGNQVGLDNCKLVRNC